jgi:NADH pyrophosphatase NudC (nudix superfamily)
MHPLEKFSYCPVCGSKHFVENGPKSKKCENCGFEYFLNPSAANVAFILNKEGQLLVLRRKREPAKGTLDLPGGFADLGETAEQGVKREVLEETGLIVKKATYLFSYPNIYLYSGFQVRTLDAFFLCEVDDTSMVKAGDDADSFQWVDIKDIHYEQFGLRSVRQGLYDFVEMQLGK